ncbi:MAG: tetratricopeptide repeat protein [Caldilineales bacterium]
MVAAQLSERGSGTSRDCAFPGWGSGADCGGAWALTHLASLLYMRSDFPAMRSRAEEALAIWRQLGHEGRSGLALALWTLGDVVMEEGDYERALVLLQESLEIYRELNDPGGIGIALMLVGRAAMRMGNYIEATTYLQEFLALAQQSGDNRNTAFALSGLGEVALHQGRHDRAIALLEEALRLNRAIGYNWGVATILGSLGWVALDQHDYVRMRANLGESLSIRMQLGDQGGIAWCLEKLAEAALVQGETATAAIRLERYLTATRVLAAAAGIRAPINSSIDAADQPAYERNLATLRTGLGEAAFTAAWAEGGTMSLVAVIACALAEPAPMGEGHPT